MLSQLECLAPDDDVPDALKETLTPYLFESGLDIQTLSRNRKHSIQSLMVYNVIDKRKRQLDDIAKGSSGLQIFLFRTRLKIKLIWESSIFEGV